MDGHRSVTQTRHRREDPGWETWLRRTEHGLKMGSPPCGLGVCRGPSLQSLYFLCNVLCRKQEHGCRQSLVNPETLQSSLAEITGIINFSLKNLRRLEKLQFPPQVRYTCCSVGAGISAEGNGTAWATLRGHNSTFACGEVGSSQQGENSLL